jgi:threonine-phosphate decarboxylase
MKTFEHGGDIEAFAKRVNCTIDKVIDLSSNINFLKPHISTDLNTLNISSYPTYNRLYKSIAQHYGVKSSQLELFNGGSSAIFELFSHLQLKQCTLYSPAYLEYKKASLLFGYEVHIINRFESMHKEVKKGSLIVFVNPSTPDGKYYDIAKLLQQWKEKKCTVLIDESFIEFTAYDSAVKYLKQYDNIYILKSMTKFYSCAGIRIGTILSRKKNIKTLKEKMPLWRLSEFDSIYLQEALKDTTFRKKTKKLTLQNRMKLIDVLQTYSFVEHIYESCANYVLIRLKGVCAHALQEHLDDYGIMVRNCENFDGLNAYHVRIAVKNTKSIQALKRALDEWNM